MPDFRHSAPASAATLGRLSKITAMTPSGTRTRSMVMPFGRCQLSVTTPTGSAIARTVAMPSAMASMRAGVSVRRSMKAELAPVARTSATSSALAARITGACLRIAPSMASSARFFCSGEASASTRAAARAAAARVVHQGRQIGAAVDGLQGSGHGLSLCSRRLPSTETAPLRSADGPSGCVPVGQWPMSRLLDRDGAGGTDHQVVAVDHLGAAGDAQDRHRRRAKSGP